MYNFQPAGYPLGAGLRTASRGLQPDGQVYSINLTTGAATFVGGLSGLVGETTGLAIATSGSFSFSANALTAPDLSGPPADLSSGLKPEIHFARDPKRRRH